MKTARVTPIHKEGSKTDVNNYRPISSLNSFSKIYEKLMHIRLLKFLGKNNSLYEMQYGFPPGRCCENALLTAHFFIGFTLKEPNFSTTIYRLLKSF